MRRSFDELVAEGASADVSGWDFSWLDGRSREQRPSWAYQRLLAQRLAEVSAGLDIQTGGGEVLAGVPVVPATMAATEGWPPNVQIATSRLDPRGVVVVADDDEPPLPFADEAFDLVCARHPATVWWAEIARVLRPGGAYFAALDAARTIKLASATTAVHRHLQQVDAGRVTAAVREHRVQALLDGVPSVMVQAGVVAGWSIYLAGGWGLATALLVTTAVSGFDWFGRVAGSVITEAPGVRAWKQATSRLAGGIDLMSLPAGVDLVQGVAPAPPIPPRTPLRQLSVLDLTAVHPDGTIGAQDVTFSVRAGELVLLLGPVGSGKSSLLAALAGLVHHTGQLQWNGIDVQDPQVFLRPGQVAYVAQLPRVLSGTFADNMRLDHRRELDRAIADAQLSPDIAAAGGLDAVVGHRGVRLSGGQVQRLAFARALATQAELALADDVSSALDARTEVELWNALRARGTTVIASTSKQAALRQADRVLVLIDGRIKVNGPWAQLAADWQHLAG